MARNLNTAIVLLTLALGFAADRAIAHRTTIAPQRSLQQLPMTIARRTGIPEALAPEVLSVLKPDDYLLRHYRGDGLPLTLFMAHYGQPHLNERIHSPSVCLPAGGWVPIDVGYQEIQIAGQPALTVNRYLVEKGGQRQVILYWFAGRGRVIASDVQAGLYLAYDTLRGRGSDETLVRLNGPVRQSADATLAEEVRFIKGLYPELRRIFAAP